MPPKAIAKARIDAEKEYIVSIIIIIIITFYLNYYASDKIIKLDSYQF
jgi:hypothetical protein